MLCQPNIRLVYGSAINRSYMVCFYGFAILPSLILGCIRATQSYIRLAEYKRPRVKGVAAREYGVALIQPNIRLGGPYTA
jgi:hypothetical protein